MKVWLWVLVVFGVVVITSGATLYNYRNEILLKVVASKTAQFEKLYKLKIEYKDIRFEGISGVSVIDLKVIPKDRDTLLVIDKFLVTAKLSPLMIGTVKTEKLTLENGRLHLVNIKGRQNFDFLLNRKPEDSTKQEEESDFAILFEKLINDFLYKVPEKMNVENFNITVTDSAGQFNLLTESVSIDNKKLHSTFRLNRNEAVWHFTGLIDPGRKKMDIKFFADNQLVELPYLEKKAKLTLKFDTLQTIMHKVEYKGRQLKLYTSLKVSNFHLKHPKISAEDIIVDRAGFDCNLFIGKNYISIDSSSAVHLKKITLHPYFKYTLKPAKSYALQVKSDRMNAQDFFSSFPKNLFSSLEGIKATGYLTYNLDFFLDSRKPDAVRFDSRLKPENFGIVSFGNTNLQKINSTFVYTPYEYGKPMRSILVGPENPNYTPLDEISNSLKYAVLTAEDGSFFRHKGFNEESFRKSIAENYTAKKFKRGGSTISMQLVKNVFLNRQKTVSRKLEEMLIVWLLENNNLVSKSRMFEVYLNIIEWGPNVYGIGEAADFYFRKHPSQLTPGESIFLASIIPKPKSYKNSITAYGTVRPYLGGYFRLVGRIMARRGQLQGYDPETLINQVQLAGYAHQQAFQNDTYKDVSTPYDEDEYEEQEVMYYRDQEKKEKKTILFPEPNFIKDWREKREERKKEQEKKAAERKKIAQQKKGVEKPAKADETGLTTLPLKTSESLRKEELTKTSQPADSGRSKSKKEPEAEVEPAEEIEKDSTDSEEN